MMIDSIPSVEKEIQHAESWLLGPQSDRPEEAPQIVRRLLMIIRFQMKDLNEMRQWARLEDGWSEK